MSDVEDISSATQAIHAAVKKINLTSELKDSLEQLNSVTELLEINPPSSSVLKRLTSLLRQELLPLYKIFPVLGIRYAVAILRRVSYKPSSLKDASTDSISCWESVQTSLLSGVLVRIYSALVALTERNLGFPRIVRLSTRRESSTAPRRENPWWVSIRSRYAALPFLTRAKILSPFIGNLLSQSRDVVVIEALLELIGKLLPSKTKTAGARLKFMQDDDQIETFHGSYASVRNLKLSTPQNGKATVSIWFSPPPSIGQITISTSSEDASTVTFDIDAEDTARFLTSLKHREVKNIEHPGKKLSKPEKSVDLNFESSKKHSILSTQEKGRDLARLWDLSNLQSLNGQVLPTSPLMSRLISDIQDAPRPLSPATALPATPSKGIPVIKMKSPYHDSIFGTTDEELTEPSDTEDKPKIRRSTRASRVKQPASVKISPVKSADSDDELVIARKTRQKRKTIVLSDVETEPRGTSSRLDKPNSAQVASESENKDGSLQVNIIGIGGTSGFVSGSPAAGHRQSALPPIKEQPKTTRKRKAAADDTDDNLLETNQHRPKRLCSRQPERSGKDTEAKPSPRNMGPIKRYGRKKRTSSPVLHQDTFDTPVSSSDIVQGKQATKKATKGGMRPTRGRNPRISNTEAMKNALDDLSKTRTNQADKSLKEVRNRDLQGTLKKKTDEGPPPKSTRRSARIAKAPAVAYECKPQEPPTIATVSAPECKEPQNIDKDDSPTNVLRELQEPSGTAKHELPVSPSGPASSQRGIFETRANSGGKVIVQEQDSDARRSEPNFEQATALSRRAEGEIGPSKIDTSEVIDLTATTPQTVKVTFKVPDIAQIKPAKASIQPPMTPQMPEISSVTVSLSPMSLPLSKLDRPRVSFAPSTAQTTFDFDAILDHELMKKTESVSPSLKHCRPQPRVHKLLETDYPQHTKLDPMSKILGVMALKTSYRFEKVGKDLRAGESEILRQAALYLEEIFVESAQHHNNFINLEKQYAAHHRKVIQGLQEVFENVNQQSLLRLQASRRWISGITSEGRRRVSSHSNGGPEGIRYAHVSAGRPANRLQTRLVHKVLTVTRDTHRFNNFHRLPVSSLLPIRHCSTIPEMATPPGLPAVSKSNDEYRLPTNVKPSHYDLTIKTDLEKLEFEGFVSIRLDVHKETSTVTLNANALELGKASIYSDGLNLEQEETAKAFNADAQRVTYSFAQPLPAGSKAELKIGFSGKLLGSMTGYYKSLYEVDGQKKAYALTQFEPTEARRAFPCWDEPLLKATFGITLISRADTVSLSNMPAVSEKVFSPAASKPNAHPDLTKLYASLDNTWKITEFQPTPPMSTYIVAFANGHFEHLESSVKMPLSGKTIPLRIYATADVIHQAQFALDVKASVLPIYEKVFDVEYPLPKLDTLVLGAMENWGLITGRTNAFLLDPKKADLAAKKWVAAVQSHEVAHMWFGNITTMEWWNYLYLNEGFATLMGEVIIAVFPEWKVDSEFITDHLNRALSLDSKLSSHPIEVECPDANHINQIFDSLSYSKAASVLRMLSNYVGEDLFLKGVSIYLKKKLYANSVTNDLWQGIGDATGKDIVSFMDNWISKIGFPVLTVTETPTGITVRQDRFLETGHAEPQDNQTIWNVPLSILSADEDGNPVLNKKPVLDAREQTFKLDTARPFKLNAGTVGVYRVLYTPERLSKIAAEAAKPNSIFSLNDRIGLVHDAMALSKAGLAKLSSALTLVYGLKNEKEYLVWSGISESLAGLVSIWWETPQIALFVPLVEKFGYEYPTTDSVDRSLLRTCAITQAAAGKDEGVIKELQRRFSLFLKTGDDSTIPADLQRVIYAVAVRHGGTVEYDAVVNLYNNAKTPTERIAAMQAMGATEDPELLKKTFNFISTQARDQDVVYFFRGLANNSKARRLLVEYFRDEYDVLYKRFESTFTLKSLVEDKDTSKYNQGLAQVLDGIRARIAYIERGSELERPAAVANVE
ncbi:hypothetical protein H0H93_005388 [Arthromyces matolae]|nr:hypothetical protein H0H93_005388 [Arthromyces matolae]